MRCGTSPIRLQEEAWLSCRSDSDPSSSLSSWMAPKMNSYHAKMYFRLIASLVTAVVVSSHCSEGIVFAQGDFGGLRVQNSFAEGSQARTQAFQPPTINDAVNQAATHLSDQADKAIGQLESQLESQPIFCLLYTSPSPRDATLSRMPSSA